MHLNQSTYVCLHNSYLINRATHKGSLIVIKIYFENHLHYITLAKKVLSIRGI